MKKVRFLIEKLSGSNQVIYPDEVVLFSGTEVEGNYLYAVYSGALILESVVSMPSEVKLKTTVERTWRNSELDRTDPLALLPDYPRDGTDLLAYRKALANYPSKLGFPYADRPKKEDFNLGRNITTGAMQSRFSITEEVSITEGTDPIAKVLLARLMNSKYAGLDQPELTEGVAYIVNFLDTGGNLYLGATPSERVSKLLEDGDMIEAYLGTLQTSL